MRRWTVIALAVPALACGLYLAVTGTLLAQMTTRILTPGTVAGLLGAATPPVDPLALGHRGDPGQALGLPFETLAIATPAGPAEAWLVDPAQGAGLAAIYVHGIAGAREDGYRHLALLQAAGIPTLLISYLNDPGAPAGPERLHAFGLLEWRDLEAAVGTMVARGHDRLILVAESMGAGVLGQFLIHSPQAGHVEAVALDSPALDFGAVLAHLARQRGLPLPRAVGWTALQILAWRLPADLRAARVAAIYRDFPGPLFLAHGTGDRIVPHGPSDDLAAARAASGIGPTFTLVTGGDHLQSWHASPDRYRAAFADFLAALGTARP